MRCVFSKKMFSKSLREIMFSYIYIAGLSILFHSTGLLHNDRNNKDKVASDRQNSN